MSLVGLVANVTLLVALEAGVTAPVTTPDPAPAPKSEIIGLWKGTSTCAKVEGNEFCNDETIVYNFVDIKSQPATVALKAARIVGGSLQQTYSLYFTFRPDSGKWTCEFKQAKVEAVWEYVVQGDALTGAAMLLPELKVVRNVTATRTQKDQVLAP